MVAGAAGVAPSPAVPIGIIEDDGLVLASYNVGGDAQPTDSVHNEGGALILQAQLELVFWGAVWQTASAPSAADVVNAVDGILGSPYLLGLKQYGFQGAAVRGSTIVTSPAPPANYSFDDVGNLVWSLIDDGKFPEPDDDGGRILYMVFMPPGTTPPPDERGAHSDPSDFDLPADVDYAWVGYASYGTLDYITDVFTHELVEAITDPEPHDPAWVMNRDINKGNEIGDACNNTVDRLGGILVQAYWSERQKACVIPMGQGPLASLQSLEEGVSLYSGSHGRAYVSLDRPTPIDVTLSLVSDNPAVLMIPASLVIPTGQVDGFVALQAQPVEGPAQFVSIHASLAGRTVSARVNVLPRPSILAGFVTDAAGTPLSTNPYDTAVLVDGLPLTAGVHMQLSTGGDGSYSTGPVSPGTYQIEASASGHVTAQTTVTVEEGVPTTEIDFALEKTLPFTVSGAVTDPSRAPIAGASVTLIQNGDDSRIVTTTDAAGGYRLSQDPGEYTGDYTLMATHPGYTVGESVITIPNGATVPEDFVLARLGSLTGLVTDPGQTPARPVPNATLQAGTVVASSDASGSYRMVLAPGPTAVTVSANGFEGQTVTVVVAGDTTNHDFALVEATAILTGTVLDGESQEPLFNATVAVDGARTIGHTDSDGAYTVLGVPAGHARVTARAPHYLSMETGIDFAAHQTVSQTLELFNHPPDPHPH